MCIYILVAIVQLGAVSALSVKISRIDEVPERNLGFCSVNFFRLGKIIADFR